MVPSRLGYQSVFWALWGSSPFFLPHTGWVNGFYVKNHVSHLQRGKESSSDSVGGDKEWLKPPAADTDSLSKTLFPCWDSTWWEVGWPDSGHGGVQVSILALLMTFWVITVPRHLGCPPAQAGCKQLLISGKNTPKTVKLHTTLK